MSAHKESLVSAVRLAYSPQEYARAMGLGLATVRRRLNDGTIPSVLLGRRRLIPAGALAQFAARDAFADFRTRLAAVREVLADLATRASAPVDAPCDVAAAQRVREELDALEVALSAWGPHSEIGRVTHIAQERV